MASQKWPTKKKIVYLPYRSIEWAGFYTGDRGHCWVFIHKYKVLKYHSRVKPHG